MAPQTHHKNSKPSTHAVAGDLRHANNQTINN